jgi:tetratricopeptide (TPR) repeat protein
MKPLFKITIALITINSSLLLSNPLYESYDLEFVGNYEEAYQKIVPLTVSYSKDYLYQYRAGWLSYVLGKFTLSLTHYSKATALEPTAIEPRLAQIKPLLALGKFRELETVCKSIIQIDSKNYTARSTLAYSLYISGDYTSSANIYSSLINDYPTDIEMLLGGAWAFYKGNNKKKALELFLIAEKLQPLNERVKEGLYYSRK